MPEAPAAWIAAQDVVYVVRRQHSERARALARARRRRSPCARPGSAAPSSAAGAPARICWFEDSVTDSFGPQLRALGGGLGFLAGSFCPHFDGEPERRPTYTRLVRAGVLAPGYAADDDAAFHFEGTELREVVSQREGAGGYRVDADGEQPLEPRRL